jgi:chaperonin GroEL
MKGVLKVCGVKTPSYGEYRVDVLNDIRSLTGGEVIGSASTTSLSNMKLEQLGSAKKVVISKSGTTFIAHDDKADVVKERVELLRSQLQNPALDDLALNKLRSRLAKLSGGVAVIRVGGSTEIEIIEKKDRVEDAVNATQAAAQEGIVSGGGGALFYTAQHLKKFPPLLRDKKAHDDLIAGVEIVIGACEAPMKQIIENTGASFEVIKQKLIDNMDKNAVLDLGVKNFVEDLKKVEGAKHVFSSSQDAMTASMRFGYDAANHSFVDMVDAGIIDPVKVTRYALEHAASIVGLMLTCNSIIISEDEEN